MGDFIDGEVFADSLLVGFPHEGAFRGVELGQEGAVALGGPERGLVRDRFVEPAGSRVDLGRGGGQSEGGHALAVFHQERKRGEAGLDGQNGDRGGGEAIRDPPLENKRKEIQAPLYTFYRYTNHY